MSTTGKVLVVLILLVLVGWIVLFSMVGQLNSNWGQAVRAQVEKTPQLEAEISKARATVFETEQDIEAQRFAAGRANRVLVAQVEDLRNRLANAKETLSRVQFQLEGQQDLIQAGQAARELREQEKKDTQEALDTALADLDSLNQQNAQLLAQLTDLQERFQATSGENRELLRRAFEEGQRPADAAAR